MKFSYKVISAIALLSGLVAAWDVDDRCLRRRELEGSPFDSNQPDFSFIENEKENTTIHSSVMFSTKSLRGAMTYANRDLESLAVFQIKIYWEEGYCWQEEWTERRWCLECEGTSCGEDDYLWLQQCSSSSMQKFVYEPVAGTGGGMIKPYSRLDLCWTRTRVNAHQLKPCGDNTTDGGVRDLQILIGFTFDSKFELHPNGYHNESNPDTFKCMLNHHHPKANEIIRADYCTVGRRDKTSNWIVVDVMGTIPSPPPTASPTDVTTSPATASPTWATTASPADGLTTSPTVSPTLKPTASPNNGASSPPTVSPTSARTISPHNEATSPPTVSPTRAHRNFLRILRLLLRSRHQ